MNQPRKPHAAASSPEADTAPPLARWLTTARREGLLTRLTAEAWHTLCAVLSFTSRDGRRPFTLEQLAHTLGLSPEHARQQLEQLTRIDWKGGPLATLEQATSGEVTGASLAPLDCLARPEVASTPEVASVPEGAAPTGTGSGEEPVASPPGLVSELAAIGLDPGQIDWLTEHYRPERIRRQLDWLPRRGARNPAAMLIRAVEQDWEPPREAA
ncbi:MAG TPA: hypothetical protein VK689_21620 [Armatimonadota bacterium]|nr:hypothetical protein [Armatimonadota bacterium]